MGTYSIPSTYAEATATLGARDSRKVANNTRVHRAGAECIAVRHWNTDILEHYADGWTAVDVNGWHTVTTWARVNAGLPGPFRIGSAGKRGTFVYWRGYAVCPYVGGIAVHAERGEVGILDKSGRFATLYTPADLAAVAEREDAARADRDRKRAARILREHPEVRPVTYRADMPHAPYGSECPLPNPHRMGSWRAVGECARCKAERDAWADIRRPILAADHAATDGRHDVTVTDGDTVYTFGTAHRVWDCPECIAAGPYAYGTRY